VSLKSSRFTLVAALLCVAAFMTTYRHVFLKLVHDWATDDNYTHGFLIPPLALYFAWERRAGIIAAPARPASAVGLLIVVGSLATLVAGSLGAELFLQRLSIIGVVLGSTLYVWGWARLRILAFPVAFLLLMIPLPAIVFNEIAFPLQLFASRVGEVALRLFGIPVLREGNLIVLANTTLEVAEACSGIKSLISLVTLGILLGYFTDERLWVRAVVAAATVPVAIVTNGIRVAGTGLAAHYIGPQAATGFLHAFSGWMMFVLAFGLLWLVQRTVVSLAPAGAHS
jgi:exosortase